MKKLIICTCLLVSVLCFKHANAQISVSVNLNIDSQPAWGPTGYNTVNYYYLPDIDCYYYVPTQQFIYFNGSSWIYASSLPPQYSNYDLYNGYKVVINGNKPYLQDNTYRVRYASYKGRRGQAVIRDSKDPKYQHAAHRPGGNNKPNKPAPARPQPKPANGNHKGNRPAPKPAQGHTQAKPAQKSHTAKKPAAAKPAQSHAQPKQGDDHSGDKKDDHQH
jgi:hypothetical protein